MHCQSLSGTGQLLGVWQAERVTVWQNESTHGEGAQNGRLLENSYRQHVCNSSVLKYSYVVTWKENVNYTCLFC